MSKMSELAIDEMNKIKGELESGVDIAKVTEVTDIVKRTFTVSEIEECIYELKDYLKFLKE